MSNDPVFLKHSLIRQIVIEMAIPEKVIEQIIGHNFKEVTKALKTNNSVEISGFGKFVARKGSIVHELGRCRQAIEKWNKDLEDPEMSDKLKEKRKAWIETWYKHIETLEGHLSKL